MELTLNVDGAEVPSDLIVQCWNGQAWQSAYVVTGLGTGDPEYAELEDGVPRSSATTTVDGHDLTVPVPPIAPATEYRILDLGVAFSVTGPVSASR